MGREWSDIDSSLAVVTGHEMKNWSEFKTSERNSTD